MDAGDVEPFENYVLVGGEAPELQRQHQQRKKERQWAKWANETIPSLLQLYFRILHESDNLRTLNHHSDVPLPACSCDRRASINVTCVFFERKLFRLQHVRHLLIWYLGLESTQIHYCQCYPTPLQLLQCGLFPCTPTAPTLAVDLKMLEFA